jgi:hypothetical protein
MKYAKIFKAVTETGEEFIGGDLEFPAWSKCKKKIKSLSVRLPHGDYICLSGYDEYNFFIGASKSFKDGKTVINHVYALGKRKNHVVSYRVTLVSFEGNKYKIGDITTRIFPFGKEGVGRTPTSGWKEGIIE